MRSTAIFLVAFTLSCETSVVRMDDDPEALCGNGSVDATEDCDDANEVRGDGCTPTCRLEGYLLAGARVWDPDLDVVNPGFCVVVRGARVVFVGPEPSDVDGLETLDLTGLTLLPGLIDAHTHLVVYPNDDAGPRLAAYLDAGVTTVRDVGSALGPILQWRATVHAAPEQGPEIITAGPLLTPPGGHPVSTLWGDDPATTASTARLVDTQGTAATALAELVLGGVDFVKVVLTDCGSLNCTRMPLAAFNAAVSGAHGNGLKVSVHTDTPADVDDALEAGADVIEHGFTLGSPDPTQLAALAQASVPVTPTLAVAEARAPSLLPALEQTVQALLAAGVTLLAGSDAPAVAYGGGLHDELRLLVEAGASPTEAVRAATVNAAKALGRADLGRLTPGCRANLIAVRGAPDTDVSDLEAPAWVLRDGVVVRSP